MVAGTLRIAAFLPCLVFACSDGLSSLDAAYVDSGPDNAADLPIRENDIRNGEADLTTRDQVIADSSDATTSSPWVVCIGGKEGWASGHSLFVDKWGHTYVTGGFGGTVQFGPLQLKESEIHKWPYGETYLAKLNPNGQVTWAAALVTGPDSIGTGVLQDASGNIYLSGSFLGKATVGKNTISAVGQYDLFLLKLDNKGNLLWTKTFGGPGWDLGGLRAIDGSGNLFMSGYFKGTSSFGPLSLISVGAEDLFVAKIDANGKTLWATRGGGIGIDAANDLTTDAKGNSYLVGHFQNKADFGTGHLTATGTTAAFVAKLTSSGNYAWAVQAGGKTASGSGVALDGAGNVRVGGYFSGTSTFGTTTLTSVSLVDGFVAGLNATGSFVWATRIGEGTVDKLAIDGKNSCISVGHFYNTTQLGAKTLVSFGNSDIIVGKVGSNGKLLGGGSGGGIGQDYGQDIAINGTNVHLTGRLWSQGNAGFGTKSCVLAGKEHLIVWKFPSTWL